MRLRLRVTTNGFYEFLLESIGDIWLSQAVASDPQEHLLRMARLCPSLIKIG